jgi:hypothetical protein
MCFLLAPDGGVDSKKIRFSRVGEDGQRKSFDLDNAFHGNGRGPQKGLAGFVYHGLMFRIVPFLDRPVHRL